MTIGDVPSAGDDDSLWIGLQEYVQATLGEVGISKMLGVRSDEDAKKLWASSVRPVRARLRGHLALVEAGPARVRVDRAVAVQFGVNRAIIEVDGRPEIRTMIVSDPAAVALATVGSARWGGPWDARLNEWGTTRPVVARDGLGDDVDLFPWVAQNPGAPGPWTAAASAAAARRAAIAEDAGFERVSSLFEEFEREAQ